MYRRLLPEKLRVVLFIWFLKLYFNNDIFGEQCSFGFCVHRLCKYMPHGRTAESLLDTDFQIFNWLHSVE